MGDLVRFTATVEKRQPSGAPSGFWRPMVRHGDGFFFLDDQWKGKLGAEGVFTAHPQDQFAKPLEWVNGKMAAPVLPT